MNANAISARRIDERDQPDKPAPDLADGFIDPADDPANRRELELAAVSIVRPIAVIPGTGRILAAGTEVIPAGTAAPRRIGVTGSRPQTQQRIAYLMVTVGAAAYIAGDPSALGSHRMSLAANVGLALDHVADAYVWAGAADTTVSWLVVGV